MQVKKVRGGTQVTAEPVEVSVLSGAVQDLMTLLGEGGSSDPDPLAALVGITSDAEKPSDPALVRLLPDAYGDDDEAAAEFRRYTDADLRAGKRAHGSVVLDTLREGTFVLDRGQADAWIGSLNDLRLVLGTRLGVEQDSEPDVDPDDPAHQALALYYWLGWMQDAVLGTISPR